MASENLVLVGDCGGTNTRLALWSLTISGELKRGEDVPGALIFTKKYENESHSSFVDICKLFLQEAEVETSPEACVLACAGPIMNNTVHFTNVASGWKISGNHLSQQLNIPTVKLINDFVAMGYGLLTLKPHEYHCLNDAEHIDDAPIATIGAGTGLGECFLTPTDNAYKCFPCEGGHTDFAPVGDLQIEMLKFLKNKFKTSTRISYERLISGKGLSNIYEFLCHKNPEKINKDVHSKWEKADAQKGAVVGMNSDSDPLCKQAMEIFVEVYGREAGNAALKYLPTGGFYITGGLAPKNLKCFTEHSRFMDAFFDKGRVSPALQSIPVYLVLTEDIGERGAHYYAYQLLRDTPETESANVEKVQALEIASLPASSNVLSWCAAAAAIGVIVGSFLNKSY